MIARQPQLEESPARTGEIARRVVPRARPERLLAALAQAWAVPLLLYAVAACAVLLRLGRHPAEPYNWETYTAWGLFPFWEHSTRAIFDLTDGLMTDSGRLPLVVLPAWLGFELGGPSLAALRAPIALIAALAVPLTWLLARQLLAPASAGPPAEQPQRPAPASTAASQAVLAALLLALAPAFLLYARTATVVGISLAPALLTVYALVRVLQDPRQWRWLALLEVMLILNSYAYAVIRFLWPIALLLLAGELLWRRGERRAFALALLLTAVMLPAALMVLDDRVENHPRAVVQQYFNGRGEQVLALNDAPEGYQYYLDPSDLDASGGLAASSTDLALRLVEENARDLGHLLLDRDTMPALTDYWNPRGRLYPWFLVPFFVTGAAVSLWRARRRVEDRALHALFWGLSLPLLLTSQVHIGRLIFALPLLFILVAIGIGASGTWLAALARRVVPTLGLDARLLVPALAIGMVAATGWAGWRDYRAAPAPTHDARVAAHLAGDAAAHRANGTSAVYVRGGGDQVEVETITVAGFRLSLDDDYQFVNLAVGERPDPSDPRPALYYGALLDRLTGAAALPCDATLYVEPYVHDRFAALAIDRLPGCPSPVQILTAGE